LVNLELITDFVAKILPYIAIPVLIAGAIYKISTWSRPPRISPLPGAPPHLRWALHPMPRGKFFSSEVQSELIPELTTIRSLFRYNKKMWVGAWPFHVGILLVLIWFFSTLIGHQLEPKYLGLSETIRIIGGVGTILVLIFTVYLIVIRLAIASIRGASTFVEFFHLLWFLGMALTGFYATFISVVDLTEVGAFFTGLITLNVNVALPFDPSGTFLACLFLSEVYLMYFPFTKMFHLASKFFSYHEVKWRD